MHNYNWPLFVVQNASDNNSLFTCEMLFVMVSIREINYIIGPLKGVSPSTLTNAMIRSHWCICTCTTRDSLRANLSYTHQWLKKYNNYTILILGSPNTVNPEKSSRVL